MLLLLQRVGYKWLNKLLSMGTLIDTIFHLTVSTPQQYSSPRDGLIIAATEPVYRVHKYAEYVPEISGDDGLDI